MKIRFLLVRCFWLPLACWGLLVSAAEPPQLRLGDEIRPLKYAAELTLIPGTATFDGSIDIQVALARPADWIWLNATELTISKATVTHNGKTQTATVETGNVDFIGLRVPAAMPAGTAVLHGERIYCGAQADRGSPGRREARPLRV